ncbi:CMRF35-like molecule 8 isoform X2 [Silurus meridionalis]|uniref:CMRF35-like molecule 8 isoform X2 n=1 Tax=Silurus meridionalis TaxID=175797 RepID=UPI001EEB3FDE|nr:CMRF35-like molecule 8 isoform X2 [Silurus meridionalis]
MKIQLLLITTFYLISGPVYCLDVTGFPGGHVIIDFKHKINWRSTVYFCKLKPGHQCERIIEARGTELIRDGHKGKFTLIFSDQSLTLIIRTLRVEDTGLYQVGEHSVWNQDINLKLNRDPCCSEMKSVAGSLGQNVTISCSYPEEFERNIKSFYKQNNRSLTEIISTSETDPHQDDRFSISDDVRNKVFSVNINDVREDDGGVYFCAVVKDETEIISHSLFTTIHLQTTEAAQFTTKNPDVPSDTPEPGFSIATITIIISTTVCVCVALLLVGGFLLIFKIRRNMIQGSAAMNQRSEANNMTSDYENETPQIQNIRMQLVYQNLNTNTNQFDSVYQSLDTNTNQLDSVYQSLDGNIN